MTTEELLKRLVEVEWSGKADGALLKRDVTCWYRNPDGPEAAALIESLQSENARLREEIGRLWMPIETAPKSKTVLIFVPMADHPGNLPVGTHKIAYQTDNGKPFIDTWRHAFGPGQGQQCGYPTHWMHLPSPPDEPAVRALATQEGSS